MYSMGHGHNLHPVFVTNTRKTMRLDVIVHLRVIHRNHDGIVINVIRMNTCQWYITLIHHYNPSKLGLYDPCGCLPGSVI